MVRLLKRGHSLDKLIHRGRGRDRGGELTAEVVIFDPKAGRQSNVSIVEKGIMTAEDDAGWAPDRNDRVPKLKHGKGAGDGGGPPATPVPNPDMELMKEKFAKLLLGEDMSGGGKGVSSALALSNAITNLAASVFGEQRRLEPMAPELKARWQKEIHWLLSVTDHIVELVPSQQTSKDGTQMEIMTTQQRFDLMMNVPALRKLDAMLLEYMDNFKDQTEFWYVKRDSNDKVGDGGAQRNEDKWWLPTVKVPPNGLSDASRKWLQCQKESVNQVLKAAMAINAQVLSEMEIPENYLESLPKNGRVSLGDALYKYITVDCFDPDQFFSMADLSTEHKVLDLKNRIEASIVIWKRKMNKDTKSWSSGVSFEKRELFEERAETTLILLKHRYPGIPQSVLDISKIQFNRDVGQSILESYSRILESLAYNVMSRIEDVLAADNAARNPPAAEPKKRPSMDADKSIKLPNPEEEAEKLNGTEGPTSLTLSDFMGWQVDQENQEPEMKKKDFDGWEGNPPPSDEPAKKGKLCSIITTKRFSYMEKLENQGGVRSPNARH